MRIVLYSILFLQLLGCDTPKKVENLETEEQLVFEEVRVDTSGIYNQIKSQYPINPYTLNSCEIQRVEITGDAYPEYFVRSSPDDYPGPPWYGEVYDGRTGVKIKIEEGGSLWARFGYELKMHPIDLNCNDNKMDFYTTFSSSGAGYFYTDFQIYTYDLETDSLRVLLRETLIDLGGFFTPDKMDYMWVDFLHNKKNFFKSINIFRGELGENEWDYESIINTNELVKKYEYSKDQGKFILVFDKTEQ